MKRFIIGIIFTFFVINSFAFSDSILVANKVSLTNIKGDTVQTLILSQNHDHTLQFIGILDENFNKVNKGKFMVWDVSDEKEVIYFPNNNSPNPPIFIIKRKIDEIFWDNYVGIIFKSNHWKSKNGMITIVKPT